MKTFKGWADDKKLSVIEPELDEATKRAGIAWWAYPDAYIRSHYPDLYFTPSAADAAQKMGNHKPEHKAPPDNAP